MPDVGPVVSNAGPLIVLAAVGQIDLVGRLYGQVLVPEAVFEEITGAGAGRPGSDELVAASWAVLMFGGQRYWAGRMPYLQPSGAGDSYGERP